MKSLRVSRDFSKMRYWSPFQLIGDNVKVECSFILFFFCQYKKFLAQFYVSIVPPNETMIIRSGFGRQLIEVHNKVDVLKASRTQSD